MRIHLLVLVCAAFSFAAFFPGLERVAAQQPHPLQAELDAAFSQASALRKQGKTAESIKQYERAAELAPQVFGPDHLNTAAILNMLGGQYIGIGRFKDAEPLLRRGLGIREDKLGKDALLVAQSLNNLGVLCQEQGRHKESEECFRRTLEIREAKLGKDAALVLDTLNNLAMLYATQGRYVEAEALLLRNIQTRESVKGKGDPDLTTPLGNLGEIYRRMGRLPEAETQQRRCLAILSTTLGKDHPDLARAMNNLAMVLDEMAAYPEAELLLRRSLAIRESKQGPTHPAIATALANLGSFYQSTGRMAEAEPLMQRGLAMQEATLGKDHPKTAVIRALLGNLYQKVGRYTEAEAAFRECLASEEVRLGKDHPEVAKTLNNLASLLKLTGRNDEALTLGERALQIGERRLGKEHLEIASYLSTLGMLYLETGRLPKAEAYQARSLAIVEKHLAKDHPRVALGLHNLAMVYVRQGQREKAELLLRRSLAIAEGKKGTIQSGVEVCLLHLAINSQALGRPAEAMALQERCMKISESELRNVLAFSSESAMQAYQETIAGLLPMTINLAAANSSGDGVAAAFTWNLRMKGIALDMLCRYREAQHLIAPDDALAARVARFRSLKQLLANAALTTPAGLSTEQTPRQTAQWRQEADALEAEINRALSRRQHGTVLDAEAISMEAVRRRLEADAALVEFCLVPIQDFKAGHWREYHYFAFVLTPGTTPPKLIDLGDASTINAAIEAFRLEFAVLAEKLKECDTAEESDAVERKLEKQFQTKSAALAKTLFEPIHTALGPARLVYLVPDGGLNRLPFEALVDGDGKYFIERYRFAYLSSGRDLLRPEIKPARGTVVFAAPDYKLAAAERVAQAEKILNKKMTPVIERPKSAPILRSIGWKALPGAAAEAGDIELALKDGAFGPVKSYVGAAALEEVLKSLPAPRVLHLATHGFFLDRELATPEDGEYADGAGAGWARGRLRVLENPLLRSGIVLAGANAVGAKTGGTRAEDGWVTAEEIALLDLRGTELVVLSACQSGLGDVKTGEGVYGLRRAFLYTGVQSMVTSLFEVPDHETQELMKRFYRELNAGHGKLASLHSSQQALLAARRAAHGAGHPFFWASFVLVGDPR